MDVYLSQRQHQQQINPTGLDCFNNLIVHLFDYKSYSTKKRKQAWTRENFVLEEERRGLTEKRKNPARNEGMSKNGFDDN